VDGCPSALVVGLQQRTRRRKREGMPEGVWWWLVSKKKSAVNNLLLRWYPVVPSDRSGLNTEIYPSVPLDQKVPRWVTGCPKKRALALAKNTPPRQVQTSGAYPSAVAGPASTFRLPFDRIRSAPVRSRGVASRRVSQIEYPSLSDMYSLYI
jgi:hypothetical protein